MLKKSLLTLVGILCFVFFAHSQSKTMVGIKVDARFSLHDFLKTEPSLSLTLNRIYNGHHGMEAGLIYYPEKNSFPIYDAYSYIGNIKITRHYLSLPLSYKYYSPKLCFSAGMSINQYLGWTANESDKIASYSSSEYGTSLGFIFSVSKQIKLSDRDLLEPTIFFHPVIDDYMKWFASIGLAYKFQIGKKE